ncbi:MAG: M6 family metalloprotease domain-containing protein [Tepidibacillus sp.]
MFRKLASFILSTSLVVSSFLVGGVNAKVEDVAKGKQLQANLASYVAATPELVDMAKEKGISLEKNDPANLVGEKHGKKFNQPDQVGVQYQPTDDEIPMLVLLIEFPDTALGAPEERVPANYFQDLIFGTEYNPYELPIFSKYATYNGTPVPTDRTMQNAYKESSYGKVTLTTYDDMTDIGWVTLPKPASYYLEQSDHFVYGNANGDARMGELIIDALKTADQVVDFSKYAVNGEVPNVFIIHEGTGGEWSRDPQQIWSHKWSTLGALFWGGWYETGYYPSDTNRDGVESDEEWNAWLEKVLPDLFYDNVLVYTYTIEPEIGGNVAGYNPFTGQYDGVYQSGPYPAQVGVFAHEFGHALGLPDFYDTAYTSEGVGNFSMMAGGSWLRYPNAGAYSGNSPSHFDPYSKMFLGWLNPIEVKPEDGAKTLTLRPVNEAQDVVKMEVPGSNGTEYFLFENIQQKGFNQGYVRVGENAHGLVAWHVDENVIKLYHTAGFRPNNVENWKNKRFQYNQYQIAADGTKVTHYGLSVVQADGNYDLEHNVNRGDERDFFKTGSQITPYTSNVHTGSYYFWSENNPVPANTGIHVTNIQENPDGSITADFYYDFGNQLK